MSVQKPLALKETPQISALNHLKEKGLGRITPGGTGMQEEKFLFRVNAADPNAPGGDPQVILSWAPTLSTTGKTFLKIRSFTYHVLATIDDEFPSYLGLVIDELSGYKGKDNQDTNVVSLSQAKSISSAKCGQIQAFNIVYENLLSQETLYDISGVGVSGLNFKIKADDTIMPLPLPNDVVILATVYKQ